jgi:hypothetical protein
VAAARSHRESSLLAAWSSSRRDTVRLKIIITF